VSFQAAQPLLDRMAERTDAFTLSLLGDAVVKVSERLGPKQAAQVAQTLLELLGKTSDTDSLAVLAAALSRIAGRLDAEGAAHVCGEAALLLIDRMKKKSTDSSLPLVLGKLAERLRPREAARAIESLRELLARPAVQLSSPLLEHGWAKVALRL